MSMKKHILITGASGFIGKHIIEKLSSKYQLFAPSHNELELTNQNAVETYFQNTSIDTVLHSANVGGTRKTAHDSHVLDINLRMFFNLVHCKKYFKTMIFLGSGAEYDKRKNLRNVKESDFNKSIPTDDYGFSKYICSTYIARQKDIVNLRLFGVYGKYEDFELRFISNSICKALLDLPITIRQNVYFDYLYIDDCIKIIDYFIHHQPIHNNYNLGNGRRINLYQIVKKIKALTQKDVPIKIIQKGWNKEYSCDITRLQTELPNFEFTDFDVSLSSMIDYYKSLLPTIKIENILRYG